MSRLSQTMDQISHKILILSGKGGVGKSTVTTQLAWCLVRMGYRVGVLDIDICGPSVPKILGLEGREVRQSPQGWIPVYVDDSKKLAVMSIGFLLEGPDDAVVWRGPRKNAMVRQFMENVVWSELDFLLVDTPPGTSDEHITIADLMQGCDPDGAVIVTTPQNVSLSDVRKEITFAQRVGFPILGIVENMSGFICPCCEERIDIFKTDGGRDLAEQLGLRFLGKIPIEPKLSVSEDLGSDFVAENSENECATEISTIASRIVQIVTEKHSTKVDGDFDPSSSCIDEGNNDTEPGLERVEA